MYTDCLPGVFHVAFIRYFALIMLVTVLGCHRRSPESNNLDGNQPLLPASSQPSESASLPSSVPKDDASNKEEAEETQVDSSNQQDLSSVDRADEQPLLLLDGEMDNHKTELMADNSRCLVCHLNYELEDIAITHAREGYGCAYCHGQSDAHIADESWASGGNGTPPDIIYRPNEVIPACLKCHELSKSDPDCHCEFPRLDEKKSCTDCHGNHRLESRKCHWK